MENLVIERITEDEFYEKFNLRKNHLDKNSGFDGCLFETYGEELEYVFKMSKKNYVVTILEGDEFDEREETYVDSSGAVITEIVSDSSMYYASGFHIVNRLGYFVLDKPYEYEFEARVK